MTDQKQHMLANRIRRFLIASKLSDKLEFVNAILSFILTLLYAISTYWENSIIPNIVYFEMPILIYMLSDYLLNFYISLNRLYYVISIQSIITYITVLPDLLILSGLITDMNIINTYELPFWKVFRIFSVGRIQIVFVRRNMSLARVYFRLAFTLGSIVLLFACIMLMIENKFYIKPTLISVAEKLALDPDAELTYQEQNVRSSPYVFHDTLYYVVVTLTTCGYGDITPKTSQGMMLFVLVIMFAIFTITS
jgi:potassium large conductance calcium-activated channel subfamily M alpha protein 1